jgi:hypothetical protein
MLDGMGRRAPDEGGCFAFVRATTSGHAERGTTIAGGTTEMQRNVISERLVGLPQDRPPGHDQHFRQIRTNDLPSSASIGSR